MDDGKIKTLLPGFPSLLSTLYDTPETYVGLLTGNWQEGAKIKLEYFGIWDYFSFGAFADDHHDRNHLLPYALERLQASHRYPVNNARTFVIGDTPRDIQCGKVHGAITVGVSTGPYTKQQLKQENPHYTFDNLADVENFLTIVNSH